MNFCSVIELHHIDHVWWNQRSLNLFCISYGISIPGEDSCSFLTKAEVGTSVMRILVWVSFPTSQGPIQHLSCFPFPHFQLLVSHFSFLISHILFPTSHSLFPTSCGKWKNDKLNYSMVLYNDSIWKRLVSLRRGINVMKAKHLQNWMKWMNVRSRKFYVGCERWEVRSWKWGFWMLTSHFPFQNIWHLNKQIVLGP